MHGIAMTHLVPKSTEKDQVGYDDETDTPEYEESYKISAELRERVHSEELPAWILAELKKKPLFQLTPPAEDTREDSMLLDDEPDVEPELNPEVMDVVEFDKVTEISYVIDVDGDIEDYTVTCRYLYDGMHIGERSSGWDENVTEYVDRVLDGEITVTTPYGHPPLSEADARLFEESFDTVMDGILHPDGGEQDEATRAAAEAEWHDEMDAHYRRALGMIALNAQRFVGMSIK